MSFDTNTNTKTAYAASGEIDLGLQSHMQKVYNTMGIGLVVTGLTAFLTATVPALYNLVFGTPLVWVAMFAPLAIIWFGLSPARVYKMSPAKVQGVFLFLALVYGLSFASIFHVFTSESIARVFFITAAMFAGTSLYGYTTKKNLAGVGSFMIMGLIGIIIASLVNLFIASSMVHFIVSVLGVVIFTGLTAWDTQRIKETYALSHGDATNSKMATMGALSLYLNFIMLFQSLINLMGER